MKTRHLRITIASALLLMPMSCMHLFDGHHSGSHYSLHSQPPSQFSICELTYGDAIDMRGIKIVQDTTEGGRSGGSGDL